LELRTKSTQVRSLLNRSPITNCVVAFSLSPDAIARKVEAKAPSLQRRLDALIKVQAHGWQVGLRFDPLIYTSNYRELYQQLFAQIFAHINLAQLHSVSLGTFRLPDTFFKKVHKLYPEEKLLAGSFENQQGMISYSNHIEQDMMNYCSEQILNHIPANKFFPCRL
jgi:spore photoproduct lyase